MKKTTVITVMALLCLCIPSMAQLKSSIQPLKIGDTVPSNLIIENVSNYSTSQIKLSDLKGKLVILDFWGNYCAPCILALHKLDNLQKQFGNRIKVITISDFDNASDLKANLNRFKQTQNLELPVVLGNQQMSAYFPYKLISHLVWINGDGVVKAITGGEYISAENITKILNADTIDWPVKKDVADFDYKKPLLNYSQLEDSRPQSIFYSAFTSHMEGIAPPTGSDTDTVMSLSIVRFYNTSLLNFIKIAIDYNTLRPIEQFNFQVADKNKYFWQGKGYSSEWKKKNTYCYYLQIPLHTSKQQIKSIVQADIIRWLQTLGIVLRKEERIVKGKKIICYTITETNDTAILQ